MQVIFRKILWKDFISIPLCCVSIRFMGKMFHFNKSLCHKKINFFFFGTDPIFFFFFFPFPLPVDEMIRVETTFLWKSKFTGDCDQWKYLKLNNENHVMDASLVGEHCGVLLTGYTEWPSPPAREGARFKPLMLHSDSGRFAMWYEP